MLWNPWTLELETCSSPNAFKELKIGCLSLRDSPITYASPVDSETNERHTTMGKHKKHWTKTWIFSSLSWKELIFATSAIYPANLQRKVMLLLCLFAPICAECLSLGDKQDLSTYIPAQFQVTRVPPRLQPSTWRSSSSYSTNEYRLWDSNVSIKLSWRYAQDVESELCRRTSRNLFKHIFSLSFVLTVPQCSCSKKDQFFFLYCFFVWVLPRKPMQTIIVIIQSYSQRFLLHIFGKDFSKQPLAIWVPWNQPWNPRLLRHEKAMLQSSIVDDWWKLDYAYTDKDYVFQKTVL